MGFGDVGKSKSGSSSKRGFGSVGLSGMQSEAGTPQRSISNYQTRLGLSGIPDEVLAKKEDPRNFLERALNTPKQSGLLGDVLDVLSRANYASANIAKEVTDKKKSGVLDVLKAGWEGLSGKERTSYTDVLGQSGMKPGIARSALGFVGDVVLDPTTYATLGASAAGKTALKLGGKAIPGTAKAIETAGKAVSPLRELAAGTKVGETFGKTLQGFRFRPAGVAKEEFKPWVETVEQFQKDYRVKPQRVMEEAIKEGKKFTTEEQKLAGRLRENPLLPKSADNFKKASDYNNTTWFHGTGNANLQAGDLDPLVGSHESLFGHGIYLTDDPGIAQGYAKARSKRTGTPTIYQTRVNVDRVLDLESPLSKDFANVILDASKFDTDVYNSVLQAATNKNVTGDYLFQAFREALANYSSDNMIPTSEFVENFQDIAIKMREIGYDAIAHTGGSRVGKKPHNVLILLDPNNMYSGAGKGSQVPMLKPYAPLEAPKPILEYAQKWAGVNKGLLTRAEKAGLKIAEIEDYLAHVPGEEFASLSKKAKAETLGGRTDPLRVYDPNKRARTLEGTVEEINQRMGGEFFEQRMPVADAVRNARLERAIATQEFLNKVVSTPDWSMPVKKGSSVPPGWKVFEPEGPFRFYPTETGIGVTKNVPRYAVPEHVGEYLEEAMKTFKDDKATEGLKNLYLNTQRLWTVSVTGLNPGYHVRNIQGNIFNSFLAGMKSPRPIMDAMGIALGKEGKTSAGLDYAQLAKEFKDEGLDISNFFSRETGEDVLSAVRRQVSGQRDKPMDAIRNVTSKVEGNAKMALFIDQRNKGKSVKEASDVVKKYLFDYQDLTQAERKIKMAIPFYTWSRKNIPLQFESMITQPGKYAGVAKGVNAIEDMSEPTVAEGDLPEWFKEEGAVRTPFKNSKGDQIYWLPNLPYLDVNTLGARDIYSRISPLLKAIPELLANQNVSLDMPIEKYEGQTVPSPVGGKIPAKADYLLKQFGVARNVGNVASTIKGTPNARTAPEIIANLLGLSNYPLNAQKATTNAAYDLVQQYADYLKKLEETEQRPGTLAEIKKGIGINLGGTKKKGRGFGGI